MTLRVLAWNVGEPPLEALPGFADAIRAVNPHIVLLNEVMRDGWVRRIVWDKGSGALSRIAYGADQVSTLARMGGYSHSAAADTASFFGGLMGFKVNGVLSRFPLTGQRNLGAIVDPELDGGRYDALEVQVNVNGRIWHVFSLRFSVHNLPNFTTHCAMLRDRILQLPPGTPVIAGGDFNGNGHNDGLFTNTNPRDPAIVQRLPLPMRDLMERTNLRSVTADLPLRIDPERPDFPPFVESTDMILYRGPVTHANTVLSKPPLPVGVPEAHMYVWSDLLEQAPSPNPVTPPITPPPFLPAPQAPFVNLQPVLTTDAKDQIRTDVAHNTSLAFVTFELVSTPATWWRKELLIMRPGQAPLTLFTYRSKRADRASINVADIPGTRVVLRKQINIFGATRTVADVLIDAVAPRSTIKLTWERD